MVSREAEDGELGAVGNVFDVNESIVLKNRGAEILLKSSSNADLPSDPYKTFPTPVILTLPGTREAYNFEVSSSMGSVTLDGEDFSGIGSTVREDNGSGCWINTSCSMGSVEIEFE